MLLDTEQAPLPSLWLLSPRWMGPFRVLACTAPNTYHLDVPATWRAFHEFNVERLRPYIRRPARLGRDAQVGPSPPVLGADGDHEHEVQELFKSKMRYRRPYVLVCRTGLDAAGDTWVPLDKLTKCEDAISAFEHATGSSLPRSTPPPPPLAGAAGAPLPIQPVALSVFEA